MRKCLAILFCVILAMPCVAFAESESPSLEELLEQWAALGKAIALPEKAIALPTEDEMIHMAVEALMACWQDEVYSDSVGMDMDGYFEIKWARVIYINDALPEGKATEIFGDMNCYVEFMVLSDYFGSHPYYGHAGINECVAYKKDGSLEVLQRNPLERYRSITYLSDFSLIIASISDRGSDFNQTHHLGK